MCLTVESQTIRPDLPPLNKCIKITEGVLDVLDTAIYVPRKDFLTFGVFVDVACDVAKSSKLVLGEVLLKQRRRICLRSVVKCAGELLFGLGQIAIVGIQVFLQDDSVL